MKITDFLDTYKRNNEIIDENISTKAQFYSKLLGLIAGTIIAFVLCVFAYNLLQFKEFIKEGIMVLALGIFVSFSIMNLFSMFYVEKELKKKNVLTDGLYKVNYLGSLFIIFSICVILMTLVLIVSGCF